MSGDIRETVAILLLWFLLKDLIASGTAAGILKANQKKKEPNK